jgi:hypothetical protein
MKFQLLTASDKISTMREPHLNLSLTLVKQDNTVEEVLLELTRDELDTLLASLSKTVQVNCDFLL